MDSTLGCPICGVILHAPYIKCAECNNPSRSFCIQCFTKGREYEDHKNDHSYMVIKNNFSLFDPLWTANEELLLLESIESRGIGNWLEISKDVGTKSRTQCEEHYVHYYIENPVIPLPMFESVELKVIDNTEQSPAVSSKFSQYPPRPVPGSTTQADMAGYMSARGEFSAEFDDFAEMHIKELAFEDDDDVITAKLKMAVLNIHLDDLQERTEKKDLLESNGLLCEKLNQDDLNRYAVLGRDFLNALKPFMTFLDPNDYYSILEGCLMEKEIKQHIELLESCQAAGVTDLDDVELYTKLKKQRDENNVSKTFTQETIGLLKDESNVIGSFLKRQVLKDYSVCDNFGTPGRRPAPPLNIACMPSYEKLTPKERDLCSTYRIIPSSYFEYKNILLNEQRKLGSLRLANARSVIKIDVNKTRKIFDLLVEEGLVVKAK